MNSKLHARKQSPTNSTFNVDHEESHFKISSDERHLLHPEDGNQEEQVQEPTLKEEIKAWCLYEFASYPVSSLSVLLLFPILIESLVKSEQDQKREIFFLGLRVESAISYVTYVGSTSVIVQAIAFVTLGSLADYGGNRKRLLQFCTYFGTLLCFCVFFASDPSKFAIAGLLQITINLFYGIAQVFFNAFLPLLVKNHPEYVSLRRNLNDAPDFHPDLLKEADRLGNLISGMSFMYGYGSSVITLILSVLLFWLWPGSLDPIRVCIAATGIWWFAFSIYTFRHLKPRPGPPLPENERYATLSLKKRK